MDKRREAEVRADFEEYCEAHDMPTDRERLTLSGYLDPETGDAWIAWLAAAKLYNDEAWNPNMDEAPRDGTAIRAWIGTNEHQLYWSTFNDTEGWCWSDNDRSISIGLTPTHWRPASRGPQS